MLPVFGGVCERGVLGEPDHYSTRSERSFLTGRKRKPWSFEVTFCTSAVYKDWDLLKSDP